MTSIATLLPAKRAVWQLFFSMLFIFATLYHSGEISVLLALKNPRDLAIGSRFISAYGPTSDR